MVTAVSAQDLHESSSPAIPLSPGWRWLAGSAVFYLICLTLATWPAVPRMATCLPSRVDPLAHIWTMRWYKSCLLEGKLPFYCPEIQYPVGAALGTLPPMHFQTLLFIPLSFVLSNDILCYNIIRTIAFLLTGLGTLMLIWQIVRDRWVATVGGMLAMLSQPMLFFSQAELEQITVGWFPLFLIAWIRWVDHPSGRGLLASVLLYLLVAMSAPYFGVFAVFPATLYVVWSWIAAARSGSSPWDWWRRRMGWFAAFASFTAPVMILLFANQIWALRHGFTLQRPDGEFYICRAPLWGYLVPTPLNRLSRVLPFDTYLMDDVGAVPSYLGVVTLGLIVYAALVRVRFARGAYWWTVFVLLLTLSLGAHMELGHYQISLPAAWLKKYFIGFRMIRVPARFSLFAAVGAAVVASAGLHHLLGRLRTVSARRLLLSLLAGAALLDLGETPYNTVTVPPIPPCYAAILKTDPNATFIDVPHFNAGAFNLPSLATYWQSIHRAPTTAGYTAFANAQADNLVYYNSPFDAFRLSLTRYLENYSAEHFELVQDSDFRSYVWLYLHTFNIRYVVFHHSADAFPERPIHPERTEALLHEALVYYDDQTAVFDREKLSKPTSPVYLYDQGWGHRVKREGDVEIMVGPIGRVMVYNPTPEQPLTLTLDAAAHKSPKHVILKADGSDVTRWTVSPNTTDLYVSPPFRLGLGLHVLTLKSDGAEKPSRSDAHIPGDKTPFALWVSGIGVKPASWEAFAGRVMGERIIR